MNGILDVIQIGVWRSSGQMRRTHTDIDLPCHAKIEEMQRHTDAREALLLKSSRQRRIDSNNRLDPGIMALLFRKEPCRPVRRSNGSTLISSLSTNALPPMNHWQSGICGLVSQ